jgi:hypothetical protein
MPCLGSDTLFGFIAKNDDFGAFDMRDNGRLYLRTLNKWGSNFGVFAIRYEQDPIHIDLLAYLQWITVHLDGFTDDGLILLSAILNNCILHKLPPSFTSPEVPRSLSQVGFYKSSYPTQTSGEVGDILPSGKASFLAANLPGD